MVYVNIKRYMKVVRSGASATFFYIKRRDSERCRASLVCACIPVTSALLDVCYWSERPITRNVVLCTNEITPKLYLVGFWIRMTLVFFLPLVVLAYCNGMIIYTVKKHVASGKSFGSKLKKAQVMPFLTVMTFLCCWVPWTVSAIYYRSHSDCNTTVVLNTCLALGNLYCVTTPFMYILAGRKRKCHRNASLSITQGVTSQTSAV